MTGVLVEAGAAYLFGDTCSTSSSVYSGVNGVQYVVLFW